MIMMIMMCSSTNDTLARTQFAISVKTSRESMLSFFNAKERGKKKSVRPRDKERERGPSLVFTGYPSIDVTSIF